MTAREPLAEIISDSCSVIIDFFPNRLLARLGFETPEDRHFRHRSAAERVAGRLKDDLGASMVRVRGHSKVLCHLGFAILALTAQNLLRLAAPLPQSTQAAQKQK